MYISNGFQRFMTRKSILDVLQQSFDGTAFTDAMSRHHFLQHGIPLALPLLCELFVSLAWGDGFNKSGILHFFSSFSTILRASFMAANTASLLSTNPSMSSGVGDAR